MEGGTENHLPVPVFDFAPQKIQTNIDEPSSGEAVIDSGTEIQPVQSTSVIDASSGVLGRGLSSKVLSSKPVEPGAEPVPTTEATGIRVEGKTDEIPTIQPEAEAEEENPWKKEWKDDEEIPLTEWFYDMIDRGKIVIDPIVWQYKGDEINKMLNTLHLVPKASKDYYKQGHPYNKTCKNKLDELVQMSDGRIRLGDIDEYIPGGPGCGLYGNSN